MIAVMRIARTAVGAALILAGAGKLAGERTVALAPVLFPGLSGPWLLVGGVVEAAIPAIEIVLGVALVLAIGRRVRNALVCALGLVFAIVSALIPDGVRCGCFGVVGAFEGPVAHRIGAAGLLVFALFVAWNEAFLRRAKRPCRS